MTALIGHMYKTLHIKLKTIYDKIHGIHKKVEKETDNAKDEAKA